MGVPMLAVPLDDFFRLCASGRTGKAGSLQGQVSSDDVTVLSLLSAADARSMRLQGCSPEWTYDSLLLLSAWAVRRQISDELGLGFGGVDETRTFRRPSLEPVIDLAPIIVQPGRQA